MAVICGAPTPATTRVVQIDPGPTPTFTASAPASTSAAAPARVATLPPTTSTLCPTSARSLATVSSTRREWPCAVSTISTSTPASTSIMARAYPSSPTPTAAATTSRPSGSLVASGYFSVLLKSLMVISPRRMPSPSMTGSFSSLCRRSRPSAASAVTPTRAVISGAGVITSCTGRLWSISKRMSRLVMIPTSRPSWSVTGTPEMRYLPHSASTWASVSSGEQVTGSVTIPASDRFTTSTCAACSSTDRLRCSTPRPPARAMAMAIRDSVTVSIGEDTSGTLIRTLRVTWVPVSTALGTTSDSAGSSSTSSKGSASIANFGGSPAPWSVIHPSYPRRRPPGRARRSGSPNCTASPVSRTEVRDRRGTGGSTVVTVPPDSLPPDPFAGDPQDPALSLDSVDAEEQDTLTEEERDEVVADLADLAVYQALLKVRGVRGIVVDCGDCGEQHFHEWSLLRASLQQLLDEGQMRPHEPAFDPDPASYVTWEYCRGYADAVLSDS